MTMWFKPLLSRTGTVTRKGEAARASESRLAEEGNFPSLPPPPVPLSTHWADDIRDVGDGGARGSPEVEDLGPRLDVDLVHPAQDRCCQLGPEGVPGTVLNFVISLLYRRDGDRSQYQALLQDPTALNSRALKRTWAPSHCKRNK